MAIINPDGLFGGERLARCSDMAQLHWVRLFTASNTFGRLELSYRNIIQVAYQSFKKKPTEAEVAGWVQEYFDNFLLFVYDAEDGSTWGQWLTSTEFLSRYHTAADRRSPAPDAKSLETYRRQYISSKQCKSLRIKRVSEPHQTTPIHTLGIGIGNGIGEKQKPSRDKREGPSKTALANSRHAEFKAAIGDYWKAKNPEVDMPWDGAEGKGLDDWLKSSPRTSVAQFTSYLRNRYRSDVNHAERPSLWIRNITSFAGGPLDRFGKPPQQGGINGNGHGDTNLAILTESLRADQARLDGNGDLSARDVGQANIFAVLGAAGKRAG